MRIPQWKKIIRHVFDERVLKESKKIKKSRKPITAKERRNALAKQDGICAYCGRRHRGRIHIHHKNFDRTDNRPRNIQALGEKCHGRLHSEYQNVRVLIDHTKWGEPIYGIRKRKIK